MTSLRLGTWQRSIVEVDIIESAMLEQPPPAWLGAVRAHYLATGRLRVEDAHREALRGWIVDVANGHDSEIERGHVDSFERECRRAASGLAARVAGARNAAMKREPTP